MVRGNDMIELRVENLHFLGDTEEVRRQDYCVHGNVIFKLDDDIIECGEEWCVSASAIRFMRSVLNNHFSGAEEHMIPCCGHFMIPAEDGKTVQIIGCNNGVDFDVIHEEENVRIRTENKEYLYSLKEYIDVVITYAEQIEEFMLKSPERIFTDDFDRAGFAAFRTEWNDLRKAMGENIEKSYVPMEISF